MQDEASSFVIDRMTDAELKAIANKVLQQERLTEADALTLYKRADVSVLGVLASVVRNRLHGNKAFFNRNIHIEPTNICLYNCKFCSYSRKEGEEGSWEYNIDQMVEKVNKYPKGAITEVHIVGGVHPNRDVYYYGKMVNAIKTARPEIHIKAFTAVEIDFMTLKAGMSVAQGFEYLKQQGLNSIPGGGAEILIDSIREQICGQKSRSNIWLQVHEAAHKAGVPSNATMLYGHVENYADRVEHLRLLRELQDRTHGFNAFIPLKYKNANNLLSNLEEITTIEDLRNYAVCRLYLDNIPHVKAYWPMIGRDVAQLSLSYGVDDLDGTIDDTTKIYSMAGAKEQAPSMNTEEMVRLITAARCVAVERDSVYNELQVF